MNHEPEMHQGGIAHTDEWLPGGPDDCGFCKRALADMRAAKNGGTVMANIMRLKSDNASHVTQNEIGREIVETAKRDGREIERYRG